MTNEMEEILGEIIQWYEKFEVGRKLTDWEREIFVDAFQRGNDFKASNRE